MHHGGKAELALMILAVIATLEKQKKHQFVRLQDIAESLGASYSYIEQTCAILRDAGLLITARGPNGGYGLAKSLTQLTLFDVVSVFPAPLIQPGSNDPVLKRVAQHLQASAREFWLDRIVS